MTSSLFALLSQRTPSLQTRKGLIVIGLQNDFISADAKLPVADTAFIDRIAQLVPHFREHGDIIWIRSEFEKTRRVNATDTPGEDTVIAGANAHPSASRKHRLSRHKPSLSLSDPNAGENDEELFLSRTSRREPCCIRGSDGADYAESIKPLIRSGKDLEVIKTHYSAFNSTSLLLALRSRLITDVYICGCLTNMSVYATAMDAARYGIDITLVGDCLGYRTRDRHETALRQLCTLTAASVTTSTKVLERLRNPTEPDDYNDDHSDSSELSEPCHVATLPDPKHIQLGTLEVDSSGEDDDCDMSLPIVGLTRLLDRRHTRDSSPAGKAGKYSHAAARPRRFNAPKCTPPDRDQHRISQNCRQHGEEFPPSKPDSCPRDRQLILFNQPYNPCKEPWTNIIPPNYSPHSSVYPRSSSSQSDLDMVKRLCRSLKSDLAQGNPMASQNTTQYPTSPSHTTRRPLLGDDGTADSAGSLILYNLLPQDLAESVCDELNTQLNWQKMYHQTGEVPRLVCCQATFGDDGSVPVYRHPSDHTLPVFPWTATVDKIRQAAEEVVGHPLNHALIQLYRDGNDFITEHSDKTLDVAFGSSIVNVSFGAQRTMRLRTKRGSVSADAGSSARVTHRVPMPHNSMIVMSLPTNAQYLHGIHWDKRRDAELSDAEKAFGRQRISLTFRQIATFSNPDSTRIWGQGATGKTPDTARPVLVGDASESDRMIRAFGKENAASSIVWHDIYGRGFDVLHL